MAKQTSKRATKKSIHEAKVQQAAQLGTSTDEFVQEAGMSVVELAVADFVERVHNNINSEPNFVTTGKISNIEIRAEGGFINVYAPAHLIYQDRGVSGTKVKYDTPHAYTNKMPPKDVFVQWIKDKKIFLTERNDYHRKMDDRLTDQEKTKDRPFKELTEDQLIDKAAWGMAKKVFQEGIKPRHIYSRELPQLVDDLKASLTDFALQQVKQQINIQPRKGGGTRIILPK